MGWPWAEGSECPICGQNAIVVNRSPIEEEVEGGLYSIEGLAYNTCTSCGESFYAGGQIDEIATKLNDAARLELQRMSCGEIREMRLELGLTQSDLEAQLGVSAGTVGRWERGLVLQGATADRLMRLLWAHPELLEELGYVAREGRGPYRKRG